jgi:alpha amylase-like protein
VPARNARRGARALPLLAALSLALGPRAFADPKPEMIIQWFSTSWAEITKRLPEIAAAGYTAVWLPPPTKGAEGVADVGFSVYDRFDLGNYDQRGTIATKYGTKDEVIALVQEAHRVGLKVYFDTVMNHNANPGKIENPGVALEPVKIEEFPGTTPLDYHVLPARDLGGGNWEVKNPSIFGGTTYTLTPFTAQREMFVPVTPIPMGTAIAGYTHLARAPWIDFNNETLLGDQNLSLLGLIDFAQEQMVQGSGPAPNDGMNMVAEQPLPRFIRNGDRPDTYPNGMPVAEDIREYLIRWIRWFGDTTDCDGLRLDAIKHVPTTFFNEDWPGDPIAFLQAFQESLNRRRGFPPGTRSGLMFGEDFTGDLNSLMPYWQGGMYVLDFPLLFTAAHDNGVFARYGDGDIGQLSFPQGGMMGAFHEFGGLGRNAGVAFVQSHDTDPPIAQPNTAYAFIMTRVGSAVVFYDGNNYNPNTFVRPARVDAVGELGSTVITDLLALRTKFGRGGMFNRFVDSDYYVYERVVPTANNQGGASLLVAITDNTTAEGRFGEFDARPLIVTEFPPGTVLEEITGNDGPQTITVVDPASVGQAARTLAESEYRRSSDFPLPPVYGFAYLKVPQGPTKGYVAFAPKTPPAMLDLTSQGAPLMDKAIETVGARRTPTGAPVPASTISAKIVPQGRTLTLTVVSDTTGAAAYARIDVADLAGHARASGTPEGLFDDFYPMTADPMTPGKFTLEDVDVAQLRGSVHLVTVRVATNGSPTFFGEAKAFFVVEGATMNADAGTPAGDGGVGADSGTTMKGGADAATTGDADAGSSTCTSDGCALEDALDTIVGLILDGRFDAQYDIDGDNAIDAVDFVLRAKGVKAP